MNSSYICVLILLLLIFVLQQNNEVVAIKKAINRRKKGDKSKMVELAKRFIGKECIVCTISNSGTQQEIIKEVSDGAILIENDNNIQVINLDYVIRIKEYPRKKNGKKKAFVLD